MFSKNWPESFVKFCRETVITLCFVIMKSQFKVLKHSPIVNFLSHFFVVPQCGLVQKCFSEMHPTHYCYADLHFSDKCQNRSREVLAKLL